MLLNLSLKGYGSSHIDNCNADCPVYPVKSVAPDIMSYNRNHQREARSVSLDVDGAVSMDWSVDVALGTGMDESSI